MHACNIVIEQHAIISAKSGDVCQACQAMQLCYDWVILPNSKNT